MGDDRETAAPQLDAHTRHAFRSFNPFAISISRNVRQNRQASGFESIDEIGIPTSPHRNSFPPRHGRGRYILVPIDSQPSSTPQPTAPSTGMTSTPLCLYNYGNNTTIVIRELSGNSDSDHRQHTETRDRERNPAGPLRRRNRQHNTQDVAAHERHNSVEFRRRDYVREFATKTLPRLIYLHLLLRLPYLYFSRVDKIFWGAELSMEEIKDMALQVGAADTAAMRNQIGHHYFVDAAEALPPAYHRLKTRWEEFIGTLMEEWKTLNIISVLLLGVIMTMFQIQGATQDPITRYVAFWSLICALMSLLYGCMFIVRFSTMRKGYRAAEWALEAQKQLNAFWNVWIMLAMPLVWLTWSIITFVICIMTFMWRSRANLPEDFVFSVSSSTEFGLRIFISVVLGVGIIYSILIAKTLRRYGTRMDEAWKQRIDEYIRTIGSQSSPTPPQYFSGPPTEEPLPVSADSTSLQAPGVRLDSVTEVTGESSLPEYITPVMARPIEDAHTGQVTDGGL